MQISELIRKKREGEVLSDEEIAALVDGYVHGRIPDYQMSAWLMAVYFQGMNDDEVRCLTNSMMRSGSTLSFEHLSASKVDKHSTGGVGDKTSLIIAPAVAACGIKVPMISGRGLGFSGGTLDKLESIPGFSVRLPLRRIYELVEKHGLALVGQTEELVPADKKMYALRDVTSTVESIPLIVASIMSKKLAEGIDALILDVKTGTGAFMRTLGRAWELARAMVETGRRMNKRVVALITDMNEPLGLKVGNALEVEESLDTLRGEGPADLTELCRELAAYMLWVGQAAPAVADGRRMYDEVIASGKALQKFQEIVEAQGGNPRIVENPGLLPQASGELKIVADRDGVVAGLDAARIGLSGVILGAGRQTVDSVIDPAVGIVMSRKTGDPVRCGDTVCTLLFNDDTRLQEAADLCRSAMIIAEKAESDRQLIKEIIQ